MLKDQNSDKAHLLEKSVKNWYVFYTYSRAEKQVCKTLKELGYEVFLPLRREKREWKNRQKKIVEFPLLPGYIFVNTYAYNIYNLERTSGICCCIKTGSRPSILRKDELDLLRKIVDTGKDISVNTGIEPGKTVKILSGPFKGYAGFVLTHYGKSRIGVYIEALNCCISIEVVNNCLAVA